MRKVRINSTLQTKLRPQILTPYWISLSSQHKKTILLKLLFGRLVFVYIIWPFNLFFALLLETIKKENICSYILHSVE